MHPIEQDCITRVTLYILLQTFITNNSYVDIDIEERKDTRGLVNTEVKGRQMILNLKNIYHVLFIYHISVS